jgi:hypothetical protein
MFGRRKSKKQEESAPGEEENKNDIEAQAPSEAGETQGTKGNNKGGFFSYFAGKGLLRSSYFSDWKREELVLVLVQAGHELRGEQQALLLSLMDECDRVFKGQAMPKKPDLPDGLMKFRMNYCAAKIQNAWLKKKRRDYSTNLDLDMDQLEQLRMMEGYGSDSSSDEEVGIEGGEVGEIDAVLAELNEALAEHWGESGLGEHGANARDEEQRQQDREMMLGVLSEAQKQETSRLIALLDQPFKMPSWDRARRSQDYLHPRKGGKGGARFRVSTTYTGRHCALGGCGEQCDYWEEGMVSEFGMFGSGITNYFKFLKWAIWVFVILTIISLPELLLNIWSNSYYSKALLSLSRTTVGNLTPQNTSAPINIHIPFCQDNLFDDNCYLNRSHIGYFYAGVDVIISLFVLVAFVWLRWFERVEEDNVDKNTIFASMYTIQVKNLPANCTEFQLTQHFNSILGGQFPIVSVHFAHRCEAEVEKCTARGLLVREKNRIIQLHRQKCQSAKFGLKDDEKLLKETLQRHRIDTLVAIKRVDINIGKYDTVLQELGKNIAEPHTAFITFEDSVAALICIDLYAEVFLDHWYFDQRLHMDGKRLRVTRAPEPSLIIWENLEHGSWDRFLRKCVTLAAALLLIAVSLVATMSDRLVALKFSNFAGQVTCPVGFHKWTTLEQTTYIDQYKDDKEMYPGLLDCFCQQLDGYEQSRDPHCKEYFYSLLRSEFLTFASSVVVLVISTLIEYALRYFIEFEKHHSEDIKQRSIFLRLFLLQYLNSSLIFLVNIENQTVLSWFGIGNKDVYNQYHQFSTVWYRIIGVSIILVQLGNVLFNQQPSLFEYMTYHTRLKAVEKSETRAVTQSELNEAHLGPEFELSFRYATLMSTMFLCLTFSSGIPLLYMITAGVFVVSFVVDKHLFVKLYKSPHRFSTRIGKQATMLIPMGVAFHLYSACWTLADGAVFSKETSTVFQYTPSSHQHTFERFAEHHPIAKNLFTKISHPETFPLFIIGTIIVGLYILYYVLRHILRLIYQVRELASGNREMKDRILELRTYHNQGTTIPFTKAVQRNVIKGLASYNLLQNPVYKHKFAITWNFAFKHQDVRSVMFMSSAQIGDDDDDVDRMYKLIRKEAKDKEYLAKMSRTNEAGLIGNIGVESSSPNNVANGVTSPRILTTLSTNSGDSSPRFSGTFASASLDPLPSGRSSSKTSAKGRPGLQRMNSTMQRQALVLDEIAAGDEAEMKEEDMNKKKKKNSQQVTALTVSTDDLHDDGPMSDGVTPEESMNGAFAFPSARRSSPHDAGGLYYDGFINNSGSIDISPQPAAKSGVRRTPPPANSVSVNNTSAPVGSMQQNNRNHNKHSKRQLPVSRADAEASFEESDRQTHYNQDRRVQQQLANEAATAIATKSSPRHNSSAPSEENMYNDNFAAAPPAATPSATVQPALGRKHTFHYSKPKHPTTADAGNDSTGILPRSPATALSVVGGGHSSSAPTAQSVGQGGSSSNNKKSSRQAAVSRAQRTPFDDVMSTSRSNSSVNASSSSNEQVIRSPELFVSASGNGPITAANGNYGGQYGGNGPFPAANGDYTSHTGQQSAYNNQYGDNGYNSSFSNGGSEYFGGNSHHNGPTNNAYGHTQPTYQTQQSGSRPQLYQDQRMSRQRRQENQFFY